MKPQTRPAPRGLYEPCSVNWKVNREAALERSLLAAARTLLPRLVPLTPSPLRHVPAARAALGRAA